MMYVLIVVLQLWLIVILVYCYKKILKEHEEREAHKALKRQMEWIACLIETAVNDPVNVYGFRVQHQKWTRIAFQELRQTPTR